MKANVWDQTFLPKYEMLHVQHFINVFIAAPSGPTFWTIYVHVWTYTFPIWTIRKLTPMCDIVWYIRGKRLKSALFWVNFSNSVINKHYWAPLVLLLCVLYILWSMISIYSIITNPLACYFKEPSFFRRYFEILITHCIGLESLSNYPSKILIVVCNSDPGIQLSLCCSSCRFCWFGSNFQRWSSHFCPRVLHASRWTLLFQWKTPEHLLHFLSSSPWKVMVVLGNLLQGWLLSIPNLGFTCSRSIILGNASFDSACTAFGLTLYRKYLQDLCSSV